MSKETPEPIHISPTLKDFIAYMKMKLKRRFKKFYSVPSTLLYYLKDSENFRVDYSEYCNRMGIENDLISEEPIEELSEGFNCGS